MYIHIAMCILLICIQLDIVCIYAAIANASTCSCMGLFAECGLAPNVTLNCNDGPTAHVEWVASQPGCQYDCTAHWICVNNSTENVNTYEDEVMVRLICLL